MKGKFTIVNYEEGGPRESQGSPNIRLVCVTNVNEKLVVWGEKGNTANIDKVIAAGLPCELECEYREPDDWAKDKFGHKYWVPQHAKVKVV